jgi:hypothetical protein
MNDYFSGHGALASKLEIRASPTLAVIVSRSAVAFTKGCRALF